MATLGTFSRNISVTGRQSLTTSSMPSRLVVTKTVTDILRDYAQVSDVQSQTSLISLTYPDGKVILSMTEPEVLYEVVNLIRVYGVSETVTILKDVRSPEDVFWNTPIMHKGREALDRESYIMQYREKGVHGVATCGRCNSKDVIFSQKQVRGGDEMTTTFFECVHCRNKWNV